MEHNETTRYIASERISNLKVAPLENYLQDSLDKVKLNTQNLKVELPNSLSDKEKLLKKAYDYTQRVYTLYQERFLEKVKEENLLNDFYFTILE